MKPKQAATQRKASEKVIYERDWQLPEFTIKEIRDAVPAHCFQKDTLRSFVYLAHDLVIVAILAYGATFIDTLPETYRYVLWPLYWITQGIVSTGVWVIAHECGHQAFSPSKFINNTVGWVLHSTLLVPYHSWRISHSRHHKATGHMTKDQVFVPLTRSNVGLPPKDQDPEDGMDHSVFDEAPITTLFNFVIMFSGGWQAYLLVNSTGQDYGRWTSHFHPSSAIFEPHQFWDVIVSVIGIIGMLFILAISSVVYTPLAVANKLLAGPYHLPTAHRSGSATLSRGGLELPARRGSDGRPVVWLVAEPLPSPYRRHPRRASLLLADAALPCAGGDGAHQEGVGEGVHQGRDVHPHRLVEKLHAM
ncbi:hypothetical protein BC936DRAFT_138891 [Jimgerdemannia flammicorona]|uniref:Fatty acid desaturase domain-containing protein n=1 Tax=Jimgerdemannia flammicorona TaxID=994334 RepID=A0A433BER1_9FUNG|nr:hypothetical protein BC936DRAFT_138891 [Jimgerdemannia flammicorona]